MARLYLDEHLGHLRSALEQSGHDVISATDHDRRGRTDAWHSRQAVIENRIILTWNRGDYGYLHQLWTTLRTLGLVPESHAGVLTRAAPRTYQSSEWLLVAAERLASGERLEGRMLIWHPGTSTWEEDKWRPED